MTTVDNRVTNLGDQVTTIDGRVTNVEGSIITIGDQVTGLANDALLWDAGIGAFSAKHGGVGPQKITNIAAGELSDTSTEAVNGSQLKATNDAVTTVDNRVTNLGGQVTTIDGRVTNVEGNIITIGDQVTSLARDALLWDAGIGAFSAKHGGAGPQKITNIAAGVLSDTSTDAVNGAQLKATNDAVTVIDGRVTTIEGSITNIANGGGIKYFHTSSTKDDSQASGMNSVAAGPAAIASGASSVAMGDEAKATADKATAVGANAIASGTGASAFGNNAKAEGNGSLAMGDGAKATKEKSTAIGSGAAATAKNAVALGADSVADRDNSVSVGSAGNERQITSVAAGVEDTDAVNVAQLKDVSGSVTNVDKRVGDVDKRVTKVEGDVTHIQNGTDGMFQVNNISNHPKPKATGRDSVAGGAGAEASGANSMAIGTSAKASGQNSVAVGANSVADRANTVAVGSAGNERQITSVAAGVEDTDAVNVAQLNESVSGITGNANAYTDSRYASLKNDLHEQDNVLSAGIAGALAQASLPQPYVAGASMAAAGVGNYRGQSAVAVGVSRISDNGKWVTKLQGSADTQGNVGVSAGVGYQW
ncbi:Autotransporter adhesin SadA [compost metagenome]